MYSSLLMRGSHQFVAIALMVLITPVPAAFAVGRTVDLHPQLTVSMEITGGRRCQENDELDSLELDVKVRFVNRGTRTLFLDRKAPRVFRKRVAKDEQSARAARWAIPSIEANPFEYEPPRQLQVADLLELRPGHRLSTRTGLILTILRPSSVASPDVLDRGTHYLVLSLAMISQTPDMTESVRKALPANARLWTQSIDTDPIRVDTEAFGHAGRCQF